MHTTARSSRSPCPCGCRLLSSVHHAWQVVICDVDEGVVERLVDKARSLSCWVRLSVKMEMEVEMEKGELWSVEMRGRLGRGVCVC